MTENPLFWLAAIILGPGGAVGVASYLRSDTLKQLHEKVDQLTNKLNGMPHTVASHDREIESLREASHEQNNDIQKLKATDQLHDLRISKLENAA
jgi:chromosome segregation ATPase